MSIFGIEPRTGKAIGGSFRLGGIAPGIYEDIPVTVIQGKKDGPTLSVTAAMHGDEVTGMHVTHSIARNPKIVKNLAGRLVLVHTLNPLGVVQGVRIHPVFGVDLNGTFGIRPEESRSSARFAAEATDRFLEALISAGPDFHVDLHCSKLRSTPFAYVAPDFKDDGLPHRQLEEVLEGVEAFGIFAALEEEETYKKHVTLTGTLRYEYGIPSFTAELGPKKQVFRRYVKVGVNGLVNLMVQRGMLPGTMRRKLVNVGIGYKGRDFHYVEGPICPQAGVVKFLIKQGDYVRVGQDIATLRDWYGKDIEGGNIVSGYEGYVLGLMDKTVFQRGDSMLKMGIVLDK